MQKRVKVNEKFRKYKKIVIVIIDTKFPILDVKYSIEEKTNQDVIVANIIQIKDSKGNI